MKDPDSLLQNVGKSILVKATIISLIVHFVLIFGTSFSLYKDWAKYGVHTPSAIKSTKDQEKREAAEAERQKKLAERAEAAAAAAASNAVPAQASAAAAGKSQENAAPAGDEKDAAVTPPEIEPAPPASLDDNALDIIGL